MHARQQVSPVAPGGIAYYLAGESLAGFFFFLLWHAYAYGLTVGVDSIYAAIYANS